VRGETGEPNYDKRNRRARLTAIGNIIPDNTLVLSQIKHMAQTIIIIDKGLP
jgi:hypothetical protein